MLLPLVLAEETSAYSIESITQSALLCVFPNEEHLLFRLLGPAVLKASDNLANDLLDFTETAHKLNGALYQLALEREGDEHEGHRLEHILCQSRTFCS